MTIGADLRLPPAALQAVRELAGSFQRGLLTHEQAAERFVALVVSVRAPRLAAPCVARSVARVIAHDEALSVRVWDVLAGFGRSPC
jgi:hypothetical protein